VLVLQLPDSGAEMGIEMQMMMGTMVVAAMKLRVDRFASRGAAVVVFCVLDAATGAGNMLTYMAMAPGQDQLEFSGADDPGLATMAALMQGSVPSLYAGPELSLAILAEIGLDADSALEAQDEEGVARLVPVPGRVRLRVAVDREAFATNVVAVLRGSDPELGKEAVVFSAHQDHVGMRLDGDAYNGADDNASGTSGLMAIAKAFAEADPKPRRSIVFLSVSGEELGLWGSAWYAKHPTWAVEDIIADINTDMIGRSGDESGPDEVAITPSFAHPQFSTMVRQAAQIAGQIGLGLRDGDAYYARSDHYNFAKIGIPVVFFCDGEHVDYHQVSDHADKLDASKMERIARLAYWTGRVIADGEGRPQVLGVSEGWR
jgi:hypothetical protein